MIRDDAGSPNDHADATGAAATDSSPHVKPGGSSACASSPSRPTVRSRMPGRCGGDAAGTARQRLRPLKRFGFTTRIAASRRSRSISCAAAPRRRCCRSTSAATRSCCCGSFGLAAHLANGQRRPGRDRRRSCRGGRTGGRDRAPRMRRGNRRGAAPLIELFTYLTTPGMCDEQITVFLGIVDASRVPERAGCRAEHEETLPMRVPIDPRLGGAGRRHRAQRPADHRAAMAGAQPRATERDRAHRHSTR